MKLHKLSLPLRDASWIGLEGTGKHACDVNLCHCIFP